MKRVKAILIIFSIPAFLLGLLLVCYPNLLRGEFSAEVKEGYQQWSRKAGTDYVLTLNGGPGNVEVSPECYRMAEKGDRFISRVEKRAFGQAITHVLMRADVIKGTYQAPFWKLYLLQLFWGLVLMVPLGLSLRISAVSLPLIVAVIIIMNGLLFLAVAVLMLVTPLVIAKIIVPGVLCVMLAAFFLAGKKRS
jgi:hypothetical protein